MYNVFKCQRAAVYHNTGRLTPAQIKARTGCTHVINGYFFDGNLNPLGWLVVDGKIISRDQFNDWGFACGPAGAPVMSVDRSLSFLGGVPILKDGKRLQRNLTADVARRAERSAVAWLADGRVLLWCDKEKLIREELQDKLLALGAVDALMMDGGGSTQGDFPEAKLTSSRKVATLLLFWAEDEIDNKTPEEGPKMFKIALGAGHGIHTAGKRCMKALDPNETREWWLNDRIADYVESNLKDYEGYSLIRLDDSDDGEENPALADRVSRANTWGADFYLSIHHNAGMNGGKGGGIVAYSYPRAGKETTAWRDELYDALIAQTGLKGNRSQGKAEGDYYVLRKSAMPAVLLELGFMDSKTDVPIILTDDYAKKCAKAITEVIVKRAKLTKKAAPAGTIYRVQMGAFANKNNAEKLAADLKAKGYQVYITKSQEV